MDGWVKYFEDGSYENGWDKDVFAGRASWSKGRLDNMRCAAAHHGSYHICIAGAGIYWQSDEYEIEIFGQTPRVVARRIQRKLQFSDMAIALYKTEHSTMLRVVSTEEAASLLYADSSVPINVSDIGKWLVLEYNAETNVTGYYISEEKI